MAKKNPLMLHGIFTMSKRFVERHQRGQIVISCSHLLTGESLDRLKLRFLPGETYMAML